VLDLTPESEEMAGEHAVEQAPVAEVDGRTREILEHRERTHRGRGWVVRRLLLAADVFGLTGAFVVSELFYARTANGLLSTFGSAAEYVLFLLTLPLWILGAKFFGLYDRDEEFTDHSTADDLVRVLLLVTLGVFLFTRIRLVTHRISPEVTKVTVYWALAIALITTGRVAARAIGRRTLSYVQNAVVVGAGEVGQLIARKLLQHPEYGIHLVGFVDDNPCELREDVAQLPVLGTQSELVEIARSYGIDRVILAFSEQHDEHLVSAVRSLRAKNVQVDVVPRMFDVVGPTASIHNVEGLPLLGLPPARISKSSQMIKRGLDIAVSLVALVVTAPIFLVVALLIKRDSKGPVFFRQTRLGMDMKEFTLFKFRTMSQDVKEDDHRAYIEATMNHNALPESSGLYKLERSGQITRVGRWLRKTSLDELPQLINVLRGDMSLVGPRPCLLYETEFFESHHFDRFLVPAGITGLWQVTARAHSTFGEALEMDVAYAHGWTLGLDVRLLARTPLQVFRSSQTG
jgi:exopolysaccharide biosynthesis polyprenyl glycosylphosphotransferase